MSTQSQLSYPLSKEESGNASWKLLHNSAAQLPDVLDRSDRVEFSRFMNMVIKRLPCVECRTHTYGYIREHPPTFTTRNEAMEYMCNFHNEVNQRLNKPTVSCQSIHINEENCPTCGVHHGQDQQSPEQSELEKEPQSEPQAETVEEQQQPPQEENKQAVEVEPDLSEDFEAYKRIQTQMFENLCKKEKVAIPPIFHAPCPEHENTSCVRKNNENGHIEVYLHPGTTDNRQRIHEFKHYLDIVKNVDSSEESANEYAMNVLSKHFKLDSVDVDKKKVEPAKVYADSTKLGVHEDIPNFDLSTENIIKDVHKKAKDEWTTYADAVTGQMIPTTATDPILAMTTVSPYTQQVMAEVEERKRKEEERIKLEETGLISNLDSIYRIPAGFVGLTAAELNNIHTPLLIKSALMTLIESNTTPFGSALISFSLGILLFLAAFVSKNRVAKRDLFALTALSASFTWNTMEYLNPKNHMKTTIMDVMKKKAKLKDMIIETPKQKKKRDFYTPHQLLMPHSAFVKRSYEATAPSDINTIRMRQSESRSRYDAGRPGPARGGRGLLPSEERALSRDYGSSAGSYYQLPSSSTGDLYGTNDYEDDIYSGGGGYMPTNPLLSQIQVISDTGDSGY